MTAGDEVSTMARIADNNTELVNTEERLFMMRAGKGEVLRILCSRGRVVLSL